MRFVKKEAGYVFSISSKYVQKKRIKEEKKTLDQLKYKREGIQSTRPPGRNIKIRCIKVLTLKNK